MAGVAGEIAGEAVAVPAGGQPAGRTTPWVPILIGLVGLLLVVGGVVLARGEGDRASAAIVEECGFP